jgi:PAS domain S-box-containing protein
MMRNLIDFSPIPHFAFDKKGLLVGANLAGAKLFGCKRKALLEEPLNRFLEPGDLPVFHEFLKTLGQRRDAHTCEIHIRRTDGTPLHISLRSMPVRDDPGHVLNCRTSLIDISSVEEAEGISRHGRSAMPLNSLTALNDGRRQVA